MKLIFFAPFLLLLSCNGKDELAKTNSLITETTEINIPVNEPSNKKYSLDSDGHPLKEGQYYAFSSGYLAGEIFNISLAKGYSLQEAKNTCYKAMKIRAVNNKDDYHLCDKLLKNLSKSPILVDIMKNDKKYKD